MGTFRDFHCCRKKLSVSPQGVVGGQIKRAYAKGDIKEGDFKALVEKFKTLLSDSAVVSELKYMTSLGYQEPVSEVQKKQRKTQGQMAFATAGISNEHPEAKASVNAYSAGKIGFLDLESLVSSLSTAIPIEQLEALFAALPKSGEAQPLPDETTNVTNIDNDFDQSQGKGQNIKTYHQKNIVTVHVKSGADPQQIASAVAQGLKQKAVVHTAEPMGDKD